MRPGEEEDINSIVIAGLIRLSPLYNKVRSRPVLLIRSIKAGRVYSNKEKSNIRPDFFLSAFYKAPSLKSSS
jgi:hypothetical protein